MSSAPTSCSHVDKLVPYFLFQVAAKFVETCTKSVMDVLKQCKLPWDATTCGWSTEEEENRIIRSNVIALLRRNPTCWTKFSNFKKRYYER